MDYLFHHISLKEASIIIGDISIFVPRFMSCEKIKFYGKNGL